MAGVCVFCGGPGVSSPDVGLVSYGHNALESLMRRSKGVEHIFGRNHDKFRNTGIAKDTPVPDAGSPASARRQQLAIADDDPAGGARVVRFQDSASTGAGGGAASTGGSSGAALTAAGSGGAGTGTGAGAGAGAGGELPSYVPCGIAACACVERTR